MNKASILHDIPRTTLRDNVVQLKSKKKGRTTTLTPEIEERLVEILIKLANWGFGLDTNDVKKIVSVLEKYYCMIRNMIIDFVSKKNFYNIFVGLNLFIY